MTRNDPKTHAKRNAWLAIAAMIAFFGGGRESFADFTVCNESDQKIAVAVGYNSAELGWLSEGWWNLERRSCAAVVKGALRNRYYISMPRVLQMGSGRRAALSKAASFA